MMDVALWIVLSVIVLFIILTVIWLIKDFKNDNRK
jgi:hypothetical protein